MDVRLNPNRIFQAMSSAVDDLLAILDLEQLDQVVASVGESTQANVIVRATSGSSFGTWTHETEPVVRGLLEKKREPRYP